MKTLVAGGTGYLGRHIIQQLLQRREDFVAIARRTGPLEHLGVGPDRLLKRELTNPISLTGSCVGVDVVISTVGITRQRDGLMYQDVDYQANRNLLDEALRAGVRKFIYVSALRGDELRHLKIFAAKERFVDELRAANIKHTVIRPNGFFSDMKDFLEMARRGRVYLFGDGNQKLNPIAGEDLAEAVLAARSMAVEEVPVGGPDVLSQNEIATMALSASAQPPHITHLPDWIRRAALGMARTFTSPQTHGPWEFFLTAMAEDFVAPQTGRHHLNAFYQAEAKTAKRN
jgi:uncharacterized protein YbjT (DUF2867 family)